MFYKRVHYACITPSYMAKAYYDVRRKEKVMVLFPFHYAVMFVWWLNLKWSCYRHKPSWIDKMVKGREEE